MSKDNLLIKSTQKNIPGKRKFSERKVYRATGFYHGSITVLKKGRVWYTVHLVPLMQRESILYMYDGH
jgi:hypothetical protein